MLASAVLALSIGRCELCAIDACTGQKPGSSKRPATERLFLAKMLLVAAGTNQIGRLNKKSGRRVFVGSVSMLSYHVA